MIYAVDSDGNALSGCPIAVNGTIGGFVVFSDLYNDGYLEIIAGSINSLVALDIKSLGNNDGYWNLFRGNEQRTGYAVFQLDQILGDINGDALLNILDLVLIANMLLENDYNAIADMNEDGTLNVLDWVILVNIILEI